MKSLIDLLVLYSLLRVFSFKKINLLTCMNRCIALQPKSTRKMVYFVGSEFYSMFSKHIDFHCI